MRDILLDITGDVTYPMQRGDSEKQHKNLLLKVAKGGFKESPTATVGVYNYLESEKVQDMLQEVRKKYTEDGMVVNTVSVIDNKIQVDANYTN